MKENNSRSKTELIHRYLLFSCSLLIIAFGISIITRSDLGTSPISSIPYVASLNTPYSMGTYFFLFTVFLIIIQVLLLGRNGVRTRKIDLLMQFPVAFLLSVFTDLTMWLLNNYIPESYYLKLISLIIGCMVLALGICLEVIADVTMISAEYTIQFATIKFKKEFGLIKVFFDVSLVVLAVILSLSMSGSIEGVRKGTIISALLTGPFVRILMPRLSFIHLWLKSNKEIGFSESEKATAPLVITISREYGSGGHQIGELIAQKLGIAFYDKELISLAAKESGFTEEFIKNNEQKLSHSLLYQMILQDYEVPLEKSLSYEDALFVTQSKIIRHIASKESCVIVGRCANYILKDHPNTINVFLHADIRHKIDRAIAEYGLSDGNAQNIIENTNQLRKEHYHHYTGQLWGDLNNYNFAFDTGIISISKVVNIMHQIITQVLKTN